MFSIHAVRRFAVFALPLLLLGSATSVGGCAGKMKPRSDRASKTANLAQYQSYRWLSDEPGMIEDGAGDPRMKTADYETRIRAAVDQALEGKGMTKAGADDSSALLVAFSVGPRVEHGFKGTGGYEIVDHDIEATVGRGMLTLYAFEPGSKKRIWRAWTSKNMNGQRDPQQVVDEAVTLLMTKFPR